MQLIASLTSPFARKVRIVLHEKALPYELVVDIPWDTDTRVPTWNPLGKVPVLVRDDGRPLYDSRVIVEWADGLGTGAKLVPDAFEPRIEARRWEALADGVTEAVVEVFLQRKRPPSERSETWIDRQRGKVDRGLAAVATQLGDRPTCLDAYTIADVSVGVLLGYLDLRLGEVDWRGRHPDLARYHERLDARPSFAGSRPPS